MILLLNWAAKMFPSLHFLSSGAVHKSDPFVSVRVIIVARNMLIRTSTRGEVSKVPRSHLRWTCRADILVILRYAVSLLAYISTLTSTGLRYELQDHPLQKVNIAQTRPMPPTPKHQDLTENVATTCISKFAAIMHFCSALFKTVTVLAILATSTSATPEPVRPVPRPELFQPGR